VGRRQDQKDAEGGDRVQLGDQVRVGVQPFLVLNYCIATSGIFPSRN
jgi:microcystin-dependent protein